MPLVYVPLAQVTDGFVRLGHGWFQPALVLRSSLPPAQVMETVRAAVQGTDPLLPLASFRALDDVRAAALGEQRLLMTLLLTLAAASLLVAGLGIHGLIATTVSERTREMGIRIALGSTSTAALRSLALPGVWLAAAGTALGVTIAASVSRLASHFVWGVSASDPLTFGLVSIVLLLVAAVASLVPARRILRLDPATTLRQE
jgi:ABC-type antimicrobial peptide transport system permease subunit